MSKATNITENNQYPYFSVLFMDNDEFFINISFLILKAFNINNIHCIHSEKQLKDRLKSSEVGILCADFSVPGIDEARIKEHLNIHYPQMVIVPILNSNDTRKMIDTIKGCLAGFIVKPLDSKNLLHTIENAIKLRLLIDSTKNQVIDQPTPTILNFPQELPSFSKIKDLLITEALNRSNGNKSEAAKLIGITRQSLFNHLKKSGLSEES